MRNILDCIINGYTIIICVTVRKDIFIIDSDSSFVIWIKLKRNSFYDMFFSVNNWLIVISLLKDFKGLRLIFF